MEPLAQALAPWHDFYGLLGTASATMIGLLFVAASVGGGVFSQNRRGALRIFLSASVVQFGCILAASLMVVAPLAGWREFGVLILAPAVFGLAYSAMAWRDTVRDGLSQRIDLEDRLWYALGPPLGYLVEAIAGIALIRRAEAGFAVLAVAMCALLLVAIHNAWDITVWSVTRRKE